MTVLALADREEPIGTAGLTEHDMDTHRELSPWLGLYTNGAEGVDAGVGWRRRSREPYMGRDVSIMSCPLPPSAGRAISRNG
jgi:hypothetical protein